MDAFGALKESVPVGHLDMTLSPQTQDFWMAVEEQADLEGGSQGARKGVIVTCPGKGWRVSAVPRLHPVLSQLQWDGWGFTKLCIGSRFYLRSHYPTRTGTSRLWSSNTAQKYRTPRQGWLSSLGRSLQWSEEKWATLSTRGLWQKENRGEVWIHQGSIRTTENTPGISNWERSVQGTDYPVDERAEKPNRVQQCTPDVGNSHEPKFHQPSGLGGGQKRKSMSQYLLSVARASTVNKIWIRFWACSDLHFHVTLFFRTPSPVGAKLLQTI